MKGTAVDPFRADDGLLMGTVESDVGDARRWYVNWEGLTNGATINSANWQVPQGLDDSSPTTSGGVTSVVLDAAGAMLRPYRVACTVGLSSGETIRRAFELRVGNSGGPAAAPYYGGNQQRQVLDIRSFGAIEGGLVDNSAAVQAADARAVVTGLPVYVPIGTWLCATYAMSSGVELFGEGDGSVLLNCWLTCTGTAGAEIPFTAPALKGARSIAIPATSLSGSWLRVSSVINCQSADAGVDQLGTHASDDSFLGEFVRVNVGGAASASLCGALVFPYSNTAGGDSGSFTTSVARVMTFHQNGRIRQLKFSGRASGQAEIILATFCRDLVIDDVTFDTNDLSANCVRLAYCLDSHIRNSRGYGLRTGVTGAQENCFIISSSQNCTANACESQNGYQGFDCTYQTNDATYRGGPSVNCGFVNCVARDASLDGMTSHYGTFGTSFINPIVSGSIRGLRIRGRKDRVLGGELVNGDGTEIGVLIDSAAGVDARVSQMHIQGYLRGIVYDRSEAGLEALETLLGCGSCEISHNTIHDCVNQAIFCDTAYTSAVLMGPRIVDNETHDCGTDHIRINSYNNGTIVARNRMSGITSGSRGLRWESNIKRLHVDELHIYNVHASGFGIGGSSTASFMTDATTFPGGEAEAELYIGRLYTNAAAPFTSILRDATAYVAPVLAGWDQFKHGLSTVSPTLDRSQFGMHLEANGIFLQAKTQDSAGAIERSHLLVMLGTNSPEGVWTATIGKLFMDTATGILYAKTSGTGNTGWVKVSAT